VRVMCKPGSVGDLGGQPPRSTRPDAPDPDAPTMPLRRSCAPIRRLGVIRKQGCRPYAEEGERVGRIMDEAFGSLGVHPTIKTMAFDLNTQKAR